MRIRKMTNLPRVMELVDGKAGIETQARACPDSMLGVHFPSDVLPLWDYI